jgi:exopolyphosphatase/guanosine-5'-triphosphate,3'-diphosphate pyrophosphatase
MRVAVIDVGSNTARLLVAQQGRRGTERIGEAKAYLGLGAEIIRNGHIGAEKLAETAAETRRFAAMARELDAAEIDVFVTSPARQAANGDLLVATIARATGHFVRVLSGEEEGELAYEGAVGAASVGKEPVAVCDVGGGSTEITVGDRSRGAFWSASADLGSLRLTAKALHDDPPTAGQLEAAGALVADVLRPLAPPQVSIALAVGGSARALAKLTGRRLDEEALGRALETIVAQPSSELAASAGFDAQRAATLAGGALILRELARLLGTPLQLGAGGLREGAAARLLRARAAA